MSDPVPPPSDLPHAPTRVAADLPFEASRVGSGRIGRLVVAYAVAVVAAAAVRTLGLVLEELWVSGFDRMIAANGWSSLLAVPVLTGIVAFVAASPFATAFLVVAEARGMRSPLIHLVTGGAIAVATQAVTTFPFGLPAASGGLLVLDAFAGMVGGWVCWIVAVRSAPPPPPPPPPLWADV